MTLVYVLLAAILGVCGFVAWKMTAKSDATGLTELQKENAALAADVKQLTQEVGKVKNDLEHTQSEKNELVGKNKTMFVQLEALKGDLKNVMQDRDDLRKRVTQFETDEKRRAKEIEQQTTQLSNAQRRFEDEQKRVIREDEERLRHLEEERDRLWANHEMSVIATLTDLYTILSKACSFSKSVD
jgi:chromosome segregation ATPase